MTDSKFYRIKVVSAVKARDAPSLVEFSIDEATAIQIAHLAEIVKTYGLYKVEKFDHRAVYLRRATDESKNDSRDEIATTAGRLSVSHTYFWFSAYVGVFQFAIRSEERLVAELFEHFRVATFLRTSTALKTQQHADSTAEHSQSPESASQTPSASQALMPSG